MSTENEEFGVAIVGMSGRFPEATNVAEFWRNLCDAKECLTTFTDEELLASGVSEEFVRHPDYVKVKGAVADIDKFDAPFFNISPREAELTDPQHRLLLEAAWEVLEDAGYDSNSYDGDIGVFAGKSMDSYLLLNVLPEFKRVFSTGSLQAAIGNDKDSITTNIAYHLNLTGPAITIQSSSSTSLVAVCSAAQSLLTWQCDMAIAGGVTLGPPTDSGYLAQEGGITARDGHCRTFDAKSSGFVPGTGLGMVALKRLPDAIKDHDHIYAVIKGFAVNNDGADKVSYTAPSINAQAKVIAQAQRMAGLKPGDITYVEAHGTGTRLGDPVEVTALSKAFGSDTSTTKQYCAIGSVKTNIGHLDTAAGVVGLIKTAMAVKQGLIPASLHYQTANPEIDFKQSPFYVNTKLAQWQPESGIRRAGVTSLGMGGTNAHAVLEQHLLPCSSNSDKGKGFYLLPFSAKNTAALDRNLQQMGLAFGALANTAIADVGFTLSQGRRAFNHRGYIITDDLSTGGHTLVHQSIDTGQCGDNNGPVCFLFSGQGSQYRQMAKDLYRNEAVFASVIDQCAEHLSGHLDVDIRQALFGADELAATDAELAETWLTQPLLFSVEYALVTLWRHFGIEPAMVVGHSLGEWVAATVAGVFKLKDALALVCLRGKLMYQAQPGAMLSVELSADECGPYLSDDIELVAVNAPQLSVLGGSNRHISALKKTLTTSGIGHRAVHTSHAFHTRMMRDAAAQLLQAFEGIEMGTPKIDMVSSVYGRLLTAQELGNAQYWSQQLVQPVHFSTAVQFLLAQDDYQFIEIGPGMTLSNLVSRHPGVAMDACIASMRSHQQVADDQATLLQSLAKLWLKGYPVNWPNLYPVQQCFRVPLPTYQFEPISYWIASPEELSHGALVQTPTPSGSEAKSGAGIEPAQQKRKARKARPQLSVEYQYPESATEFSLVEMYSELFGIEVVGIHDDFFELGGHSLMASMLVSQISAYFSLNLTIVAFFDAPNIAALAKKLDAAGKDKADQEDVVDGWLNEL